MIVLYIQVTRQGRTTTLQTFTGTGIVGGEFLWNIQIASAHTHDFASDRESECPARHVNFCSLTHTLLDDAWPIMPGWFVCNSTQGISNT